MVVILKFLKSTSTVSVEVDDRFTDKRTFTQTDGDLIYLTLGDFGIKVNFHDADVWTTAEVHVLINKLYLPSENISIFFDKETSIIYKKLDILIWRDDDSDDYDDSDD